MEVHRLGSWDYVVIVLSLLASLCIGFRFFASGSQKTSDDFMLAGRNMSRLPVILSIVVTHLSAILMLGAPAEIYRYGSQLMMLIVGMVLGIFSASKLMVPIYFNLGISSIYEYLEMRYGKYIRLTVSGLFLLQMVLYMSVVLNAPALALSAVTDLSTETSILLIGIVCVVYCTMGGLKAVLWTDTLQSGLMFACLVVIFIVGMKEAGGLDDVIKMSKEGGRWEFFNFRFDLTTRYTVWNALLRGLSLGVGGYGMSQLEIQRLLSINHLKDAQAALLWSILPMMVIVFMSYFMGLILYAIFSGCDPILDSEHTALMKHDQMVPYYIITRLSHIPGLTGLCIAGLFGGSLSTISSAINSISTVTVIDFIQPYCVCWKFQDSKILWIAKSLVVAYGAMCIGLTFALSQIGSLTQMATVAIGIIEGPVIAIFLLGILTTRNNEKGSIIGFFIGSALSGWVGFGSTFAGYIYPTLPMSTENCPSMLNYTQAPTTFASTVSLLNTTDKNQNLTTNTFFLYRISYMWIPTLGFICTTLTSYAVSILIDWNEKKIIDSNYLSPIVKMWTNSGFDDTDEQELEVRNRISVPDAPLSTKRNSIANCTL